jgi:hypothetical protein
MVKYIEEVYMKYITFFLFLLLLVGCTPKEEPLTLRDLIDDIPIPTQTDVDLVLPTSYILNEKNIILMSSLMMEKLQD